MVETETAKDHCLDIDFDKLGSIVWLQTRRRSRYFTYRLETIIGLLSVPIVICN